MTSLTKAMKSKMITNIIADLPRTDFVQQGVDYITAQFTAKLPEPIRAALDDNELRKFVKRGRLSTRCAGITAYVPWHSDWVEWHDAIAHVGQEAWDVFLDFFRKNTEQREAAASLYRQLEANFSEVKSFKGFRARFPELVKYLPDEPGSSANLPATTALVDMLKEAGLRLETELAGEPA